MNITMDSYLKQKPAWMQLVIFGAMAFGIGILASIVGVFIVHIVTGLTIPEIGSLQPKDFAKPEYGNVVKGLLLVQNIFRIILKALWHKRGSIHQLPMVRMPFKNL